MRKILGKRTFGDCQGDKVYGNGLWEGTVTEIYLNHVTVVTGEYVTSCCHWVG
jgi:hypothetical protein